MARARRPPGRRLHLFDLPKISGPLFIIACGDGRLTKFLEKILEKTGAPWYFVKTFAGGTWYLDDKEVHRVIKEMRDVERERGGAKFVAIVDLQHIQCAAQGFFGVKGLIRKQLRVVMDSQDDGARVLRGAGIRLPIFKLVVHPITGNFFSDRQAHGSLRSRSSRTRQGVR